MNKEYETGYTMGTIRGEEDATLLVAPYPYTSGEDTFCLGYKNGYIKRYTQGLSAKLKENPEQKVQMIIADRLEEISNCMKLENEKLNRK